MNRDELEQLSNENNERMYKLDIAYRRAARRSERCTYLMAGILLALIIASCAIIPQDVRADEPKSRIEILAAHCYNTMTAGDKTKYYKADTIWLSGRHFCTYLAIKFVEREKRRRRDRSI